MTEAQRRRERVLAWLKEHPDSTAREVAEALFPEGCIMMVCAM